jgi:RHS repeat-associated protein
MATISGDYYVNSTSEKEAVVLNAQDYYAFGSLIPGRTYTAAGQGSYRYGFNGKENDNEIKGEGNQQDYGFRIYDPRLGRFLSIDPLTKKYPELTPYQFASNTPIQAIDLDGLEMFLVNGYDGSSNLTKFQGIPEDYQKMLKYWTNNNPSFIQQAAERFKETDVRFLDGSQGGISHGSVKVRHDAGYDMAMALVNAKQVDFSKPITILGHSMGGAYADGMTDGFLKANPKAVINVLLLAPDGAEQFDIDPRANSAQFTFRDDVVVTNNKAVVGNVDVNLNPQGQEFRPYQTGLLKGLEAHSAPIDDKGMSSVILNDKRTEKVFKTKADEKKITLLHII